MYSFNYCVSRKHSDNRINGMYTGVQKCTVSIPREDKQRNIWHFKVTGTAIETADGIRMLRTDTVIYGKNKDVLLRRDREI